MGYDGVIIYCVYLHDKVKVIWIKDLRIFKNVNEKKSSQVYSFNAITSLEP